MLFVISLLLQVVTPESGSRSDVARAEPWHLRATPQAAYSHVVSGRVIDAAGATLTLRAHDRASHGRASLTLTLPADTLRGRRVQLSGAVRTRGVQSGAMMLLRADSATQMLTFERTEAHSGDSDWSTVSLGIPLEPAATSVAVELHLIGGGIVEARNLRLASQTLPGTTAPMSEAAQRMLDSALVIAKTHSLWRDTVTWSVVEPAVRHLAAGAARPQDVYSAIRMLLRRLGDGHSTFVPAPTPPLGSARATSPPRPAASTPTAARPAPAVRVDGSVGYIAIPGFSGADSAAMSKFAAVAHSAMLHGSDAARCGWIVDLRENRGGNMWPMLAALRPLLGTAAVGAFVGPGAERGSEWIAGSRVHAPMPRELERLHTSRVAVLHGPRTTSSGEAVAIAFRGREATRSFGQATRGLSTSNDMFPLPDGSTMVMTDQFFADRTGARYGGVVRPDVIVEDGSGDKATLVAARTWLERSCDHARRAH